MSIAAKVQPGIHIAECLTCPVPLAGVPLGQCNLLVNPSFTEFGLAWHRDMVPATVTAAEEAAALAEGAREQTSVQWNTALFEDACFVFVP